MAVHVYYLTSSEKDMKWKYITTKTLSRWLYEISIHKDQNGFFITVSFSFGKEWAGFLLFLNTLSFFWWVCSALLGWNKRQLYFITTLKPITNLNSIIFLKNVLKLKLSFIRPVREINSGFQDLNAKRAVVLHVVLSIFSRKRA